MGVNFPAIIVNFKAYESALGEGAALLARLHDQVAKETGASLGIAVSFLDLGNLASKVSIPVFTQHVDPVEYGARTGQMPPVAVKQFGAFGTLLNHAERRLPLEILQKTIETCRGAGLFTLVCAESPEKVQEILAFKPDAIAYEPPELIGGNVSVSQAQPEVIARVVAIAGATPLLVGAGVKTEQDVRVSLQLGARGVLLASGVTLAPNPEDVLRQLVKGTIS